MEGYDVVIVVDGFSHGWPQDLGERKAPGCLAGISSKAKRRARSDKSTLSAGDTSPHLTTTATIMKEKEKKGYSFFANCPK